MSEYSNQILLPADLKPLKDLSDYKAIGGTQGIEKARSLDPQVVIETIKDSGLRGRGGAGFPTWIKWNGVRQDPCPTKYIVCNGSEGEPGTYKDRYLLGKNPYFLIEGLCIAGYAIGVKGAIIGIKGKYEHEISRINQAIREFEEAGLMEKGFIEVVHGPDAYLFGEEKALLEVIDGRDPMPRHLPPYVLGARYTPTSNNPTVVNNIETLSHLPQIMWKGVDWFKSFGSERSPGTTIFTLVGDVKRPGMYELPLGTSMRTLLEEYGQGPVGKHPFKAVFSGVACGAITEDRFDTPMDFDDLKAAGGGLGSAGFIVFDESASMVTVAYQFSMFLHTESCGQCVPCKKGSELVTEILERVKDGKGKEGDIEDILFECTKTTSQTRCFLSHEERIVVTSIVETFRKEFEEQIKNPKKFHREHILGKIKSFDEENNKFGLVDYFSGLNHLV